MSIAARFGENLKVARRAAGYSQEAVGIRASLHRTEVGLLERGERLPRLDTAIKLAASLGAPIGTLCAGIDWRPGISEAGGFKVQSPREQQEAVLDRVAAFRGKHSGGKTDTARLVREGRDELERRGEGSDT